MVASNEPDRSEDLTERERSVLDAVVRTYVSTAEPAGSRTVAKSFGLGISAATIRNTMADLEDKGYLFHPHTSAGRIPTDRAYRYFVDRIMTPASLTRRQRDRVESAIDARSSAVEQLVGQAAKALGLLTEELGLAIAPHLDSAVLEKIELVHASSSTVLMVATIRSGLARTVFFDLRSEVPRDTLVTLTVILNERLAGLTLRQIRETLPARLRDSSGGDTATDELLNVFIQSGADLFDWSDVVGGEVHLGQTSVLAAQPEFSTGADLKNLIELTERTEVLRGALSNRTHQGGLQITIGGENDSEILSEFSLVTAEYRTGNLKGVIGVIGPTRMPYEKVIAIVDYTSMLINRILEG